MTTETRPQHSSPASPHVSPEKEHGSGNKDQKVHQCNGNGVGSDPLPDTQLGDDADPVAS